MKTYDSLQKHMILVHEVKIKALPEKIWEFLTHIEANYKAWHPGDHILFRWTRGAPFEKGAPFYAEQNMMSEKVKYKGKISECVPGERIIMNFSFPLSLITEKIEMLVEDHGSFSVFKHVTHMKFRFLSRKLFKKQNIQLLNDMDAHVRTEGENMKKIIEKTEKDIVI